MESSVFSLELKLHLILWLVYHSKLVLMSLDLGKRVGKTISNFLHIYACPMFDRDLEI